MTKRLGVFDYRAGARGVEWQRQNPGATRVMGVRLTAEEFEAFSAMVDPMIIGDRARHGQLWVTAHIPDLLPPAGNEPVAEPIEMILVMRGRNSTDP